MFAVIDIETVPDVQRWTPPADTPDVFPPVWAHRIVCIGLLVLDNDYQLVSLDAMTEGAGLGDLFARGNGDADSRERDLLLGFSRRITKLATTGITIVTYNGRTFDIPAIVHRCLAHTVPLPWLWRDRGLLYAYDENRHIDGPALLTKLRARSMPSQSSSGCRGKSASTASRSPISMRAASSPRSRTTAAPMSCRRRSYCCACG